MPRKKNPNNNYFNEDVETAIHTYNVCSDEREKNRIFRIIYPALAKVAEVWRNKIKPTYVELPPDELEMDCICFMLEKLPMIKAGKGRAFSYLTVTARNYYIQANMVAYRKKLRGDSLDALPEHFDVVEVVSDRVEQMESNAKLFYSFMEYVEHNFDDMFPTKAQKKFANSFIPKVKGFQFADEINRKDLLNDIADESGIKRGLVTKHMNRVASFFSIFKDHFEVYGVHPKFKEKLHLNEDDKEYIRKNYQHYSKHSGLSGISRKLGINYEMVRQYVKQSHM